MTEHARNPTAEPASAPSTLSIRTLHTIFGIVIGVALAVWIPPAYRSFTRSLHTEVTLADSFNFTGLIIPRDEILRGGPAKDGIPSLTDPHVVPIAEMPDLLPEDRVIGMDVGGERRAYPIRLLDYHEIVNDTLGGVPLAVIYCPLCDSVSAVDRRIDDRTLTFGVSGLLHNSNVLMYDRQDDALWSQLGFEAVSGPLAGRALEHLPWELTTLESWAMRHPESTIVSFNTGHHRSYHASPYASYFEHDELMFPVRHQDGRLGAKEPVIGIRIGDIAKAYTVAFVRAAGGRIEETFGSGRLVIVATEHQEGVAVLEIPTGAHVAHTFWFSWSAFHPHTELVDVEDR